MFHKDFDTTTKISVIMLITGALMNISATYANGFKMPVVHTSRLTYHFLDKGKHIIYRNLGDFKKIKLYFFADIFHVIYFWRKKVQFMYFSLGDAIIMFGIAINAFNLLIS